MAKYRTTVMFDAIQKDVNIEINVHLMQLLQKLNAKFPEVITSFKTEEINEA